MKIGVIGNGFVGKATCILQNKDVDIIVYDLNPQLCDPPGSTINDLKSCDLIFVSVPTPMNKDGSCHVEIVESVVKNLRQNNIINEPNNFVVIRSTVIPGTSDQFFMNKINKLFTLGKINGCIKSNSTSFVLNKEAEMIKYFRNCFLALKISFCNEIYDYCQLQNINYEIVRHQATKDDRIGWSHSCVPGHDEKRGYGGTCLPKDTKALLYSMKNLGSSSYIFDAMDARNDNIDRIDQDWASNIGRSVLG
jgi:UDPglucose 6-dehydrogenase